MKKLAINIIGIGNGIATAFLLGAGTSSIGSVENPAAVILLVVGAASLAGTI